MTPEETVARLEELEQLLGHEQHHVSQRPRHRTPLSENCYTI